eukprot:TRINITY_DN3263_c0_g1_i1.p1 TRINITY_DN3263_c0_g1~~TRINITY_DN3263_c0_g1_i1.p1  ORF type:complete len:766 (-),score=157.67 TRINITY_DN3263_c0_g1_i1:32-2329(-)
MSITESNEAAIQALLDNEAELDKIAESTALDPVILQSLNNPRDRLLLFKLDAELGAFVEDKIAQRLEFPPMSSYHRLLVHRVAHYFKLDHKVDGSGKKVVLFKTTESAIPVLRIRDLHEQDDAPIAPKLQLMKRKTEPSQDALFAAAAALQASTQDLTAAEEKKFEERLEEYAKARARIFKDHEELSAADLKALDDSRRLRSRLVQEYEEQAQYAEEVANELFAQPSETSGVGIRPSLSHFFPQTSGHDDGDAVAVPTFPPPFYGDLFGYMYPPVATASAVPVTTAPNVVPQPVVMHPLPPALPLAGQIPSGAVIGSNLPTPTASDAVVDSADSQTGAAFLNPANDEEWPLPQKLAGARPVAQHGALVPGVSATTATVPPPVSTASIPTTSVSSLPAAASAPPVVIPVPAPALLPAPRYSGVLNATAMAFHPSAPVAVAPVQVSTQLMQPSAFSQDSWGVPGAATNSHPYQPYGGAFAAPLLPFGSTPILAAPQQQQQQQPQQQAPMQSKPRRQQGRSTARAVPQYWDASQEPMYGMYPPQWQQPPPLVYDVHRRNAPRSRTLFDPYKKDSRPPQAQQAYSPAPPPQQQQQYPQVPISQSASQRVGVAVAPAGLLAPPSLPPQPSHQLLFDYSMPAYDRTYTRSDTKAPVMPNHIMQVCGLDNISRREADRLLGDIRRKGAKVKWLNKQTVIAIFKNARKAEQAVTAVSKTKLELQPFSPTILKRPALSGEPEDPTQAAAQAVAALNLAELPDVVDGDVGGAEDD